MPEPLPIPKEVIDGIEDVIDQSRLAGFNHGHAVGFSDGIKAAIEALEVLFLTESKPKTFVDIAREDFGLANDSGLAPIREAYGFEIIETDSVLPKPRKKRLVSVKALGLSTKTQNSLLNAGVLKIKQLTEMSAADLRKLPRIGAGSVKEIESVLKKHGRSLKA